MDTEPKINKTNTTTVILVVVIVILLGLIGFALFNLTLPNQSDESPIVNTLSSEKYEAEEQAVDTTFWKDREYIEATERLENLLAGGELSIGQAIDTRLQLGTLYIRNEQDKAAEVLAEVYNDPVAFDVAKASALESISWHISSHYNGTVDDAYVNRVYGPALFDLLPENTTVTGYEAVRPLLIQAFARVSELDSGRPMAHLLSANNYRFELYPEQSDEDHLNFVKGHLVLGLGALDDTKIWSLENDVFNSHVGIGLLMAMQVEIRLFENELGEFEAVAEMADQTLEYVTPFKDDHFTAIITAAETVYRRAVTSVIHHEFELPEAEQTLITQHLEDHIYPLNDEDLARREYLAYYGNEAGIDPDPIYQTRREALIYIATEVDPRLKDFLIDRVEYWSKEDFPDATE